MKANKNINGYYLTVKYNHTGWSLIGNIYSTKEEAERLADELRLKHPSREYKVNEWY